MVIGEAGVCAGDCRSLLAFRLGPFCVFLAGGFAIPSNCGIFRGPDTVADVWTSALGPLGALGTRCLAVLLSAWGRWRICFPAGGIESAASSTGAGTEAAGAREPLNRFRS